MKKSNLGYLIMIIIGVLAILCLCARNNAIDKGLSDYNNTVELFSKN